jgi:hypothetical protein
MNRDATQRPRSAGTAKAAARRRGLLAAGLERPHEVANCEKKPRLRGAYKKRSERQPGVDLSEEAFDKAIRELLKPKGKRGNG